MADRVDREAPGIARVIRANVGRLIIPAPVTAEIDYMLNARIGAAAARNFLSDLADGLFRVECLDSADYRTVVELEHRYEALRPGLADLSIIVLAARFDTARILTFDRHFRVFQPLGGGAFRLLPADD